MTDILNLEKDYILFSNKGQAVHWKAKDFWAAAFAESHPAIHKDMGSLISRYAFNEDWKSWEKHPHGDELIYITKGKMTFILEGKGEIALKEGDAFLIPKGTWHTAKVSEPSAALFITYGYGTEHKDA